MLFLFFIILLFLIPAIAVSLILIFIFFSLGFLNLKRDLLKDNIGTFSIYECRYSMLSNDGFFYTLQFFLIAISFIFFDLEVVLFLPFLFSHIFNLNVIIFILLFLIFLTRRLVLEFTLRVF